MTATAPEPSRISELDEARLTKLLGEVAGAKVKLADAETKLAAFCRAWSEEHGYGVHLTVEQVKLEFAMRGKRPCSTS